MDELLAEQGLLRAEAGDIIRLWDEGGCRMEMLKANADALGIRAGDIGRLVWETDAPDAPDGDAVDAALDELQGLAEQLRRDAWHEESSPMLTHSTNVQMKVVAARAQHARDRAELESLQERVGQAEGYEALYRGVCEARDVLAAELEALREEEEGERVIRLESDTPLRAITPGGGIISTVMFEKGLYAIRPVEEKAKVHTMRCGICGKQFDMRDLDQVFYHEQNPHRPLTDEERALALCDSRRVEEPKVRPWRAIRSVGSRLHKNEAWSICPGPEGEECGCIVSYDDARPDTCPNCLSPLDWSELPEGDDE